LCFAFTNQSYRMPSKMQAGSTFDSPQTISIRHTLQYRSSPSRPHPCKIYQLAKSEWKM
jgi:hypothetical protein